MTIAVSVLLMVVTRLTVMVVWMAICFEMSLSVVLNESEAVTNFAMVLAKYAMVSVKDVIVSSRVCE